MVSYLYSLWSSHPSKSSTHWNTHLSQYYWLCFHPVLTSAWLSVTGSLCFLAPSPFTPIPSTPPSSANYQFVLWVYVLFAHLFYFLDFNVIEIIWYLSFSVWLIWLIITLSRFILFMTHILLCICTTSLSTCLFMDTWVTSVSWLL